MLPFMGNQTALPAMLGLCLASLAVPRARAAQPPPSKGNILMRKQQREDKVKGCLRAGKLHQASL